MAWHYNTHLTLYKPHNAHAILTCNNSLHNMLWRTCTPPLLPLQGCLLLRPQLPKVRLEVPPQRLRTHHADLLCTCYTKLLQPHQPHERILKMKVIVQETAIVQQYPHAAKRNERWSQRSRGAAKGERWT
jgi:hypothetical protein